MGFTMKGMKLIRVSLLGIFCFGSIQMMQAQDVNEAKAAYNAALQIMKTDPATAVKSLESCIELCGKIGAPADSVKTAAHSKFAETYFNLASNQARDKNLDGAVISFKEAQKYGQQTNNAEVLKRTTSALVRVYAMQANTILTQKDPVKAQETLNMAMQLDTLNVPVWLVQMKIFQDTDNAAGVESAIQKCITISKNPNETRQAQQSGVKYFLSKGSKAVNASKFDEGAANLEKAFLYDPANKDVLAYLTKAYNGLSQWDKAIETANKGIAIEEDVPEKEAKFWFEIGLAYKGKGDKTNACESFKKAMVGQYLENAKYEIEVDLKCGK
jgi:tetratricopeptide (TPR) repeat protein